MMDGAHGYRQLILKVRQQPERARLCSFKEENDTIDRRPVDPPPVVQVLTSRSDSSPIFESTSYFIRASIVHPHGTVSPTGEDEYLPVKTPTGADATAGEVIQTPERLKGLDGTYGALVIFAKLSVRVPGIFRLKFTLYNTTESGVVEITSTVSEPFEVFSPKLFKGMRESTALTRHLAGQGLKVKLRTDTTVGRQSDSRKRSHQTARTSAASTPVLSPSPPAPRISASSGPPGSSTSRDHVPMRHPGPVRHSTHQHSILGLSGPPPNPLAYMSHPPPPHPPHHALPHLPPAYSSNPSHGLPGYRSAPPPPPPSRSLVWHPTMNHRHPESSSSRGPSPVLHPNTRRRGDDGLPHMRELTARYDYTPTPPSCDLSAFSLSHDPKRPESNNTPSSMTSSRATSTSRTFSPFSAPSSASQSMSSWSSSIRSDSPGDDGIAILPSFLRTAPSISGGPSSTPVLPPPLPSFLGGGQTVISPVPMLPPIRHPEDEYAERSRPREFDKAYMTQRRSSQGH
ncbi:velvet factor-domain-containing protein [Papiliotrema laurentii]|uniref:Velvet factor-domain-containing protein n=1 Tax=Papiliotrema laurentii TaxID=5418 RepID=A0AAD9CZN2_PAPLA|nr:velvet factor-domain-containing protein [Papiliotrema laurentii]